MKKLMLSLSLLMLVPLTAALAGESVSIGVSCTIPAVPGLNAPVVEKAAVTSGMVVKKDDAVRTYYVR